MSRFVPWALVALCFALGVASRSISDSFVVFVPALQSAFDASRSAITVVYSFALLVGGTGAPLAGWIVDRFGLRALTVIGMSASALATASASMATEVWHFYLSLGVIMGFAGASLSGVLSASLLGRWFPATIEGQKSPFWQADRHRKAVYNQFTGGTQPFDFTKNYKFTILNNENVWAKAMNRVVSEKVPVEKAVDELIARIKEVAG